MSSGEEASDVPPSGKGRARPPPVLDLEATEAEPTAAGRNSTAWLPSGIPWTLIAFALAGGALVLVTALLVGFLSRDGDTSALSRDVRFARLEQQLRELATRPAAERSPNEDIAARLARLETMLAAPRPSTPDPAFANRLALLEGEVKAMAESVSIIGRRGDEISIVAREARQRADASAAALAELSQKIARLPAGGPTQGELETLAKRLDALERAERAVEAELARQSSANEIDRPLRLAVVTATLKAAIERGESYATELAAAKRLGGDSKLLATLEPFAATGVPSAPALARELTALAAALHAAAGTPAREGFLDRLAAGAEKLVRVRPLEEIPGTDAAAIIARIEAKAVQTDLAGALAELASLAPAVRAPAEPWMRKAEARAGAIEAGRRLAAAAQAELGKP